MLLPHLAVEQSLHTFRPQNRQWWCLVNSPNLVLHSWHLGASESGTHVALADMGTLLATRLNAEL